MAGACSLHHVQDSGAGNISSIQQAPALDSAGEKAVKELEMLGGGKWARQQVVEAYLACDRNLDAAAGLLFSS
eukprot:SAG31_NODE_4957_length_2836_cov_2.451023_3_plen_73_part_00